MWGSSFAERGPLYKSLPFFLGVWGPAYCRHWPAHSSPLIAPSCVYSKQLIRIADVFFPGVALTPISLLIPGHQLSVSETSLGFRDVDFDAVCAFRSGVLAKGRGLFRSQQPLASLLPLLLCRSRRRWGRGVGALLAAQQRSSLTGLLWRWRSRLVLLLEWWNMTQGDRDTATDKRVRECQVKPD